MSTLALNMRCNGCNVSIVIIGGGTVADNPGSGECTFPAVLQRGNLEIAVSTGGHCPTFAVERESC